MNSRLNKVFFIFLTLLLFTSLGCKKDNNDCTTHMVYEQTGCSDPWKYSDDSNTQIQFLKDHLASLGIAPLHVDFLPDGTVDFCRACFCRTGKRFHIKVKNADVDKLLELRFKINQ
jgi:hypothetical protein